VVTKARRRATILIQLILFYISHPIFWAFILILSSHLRLGPTNGLFPSGFKTKILYAFFHPLHARDMPCPIHRPRFEYPKDI
jgi:hypothetical protein